MSIELKNLICYNNDIVSSLDEVQKITSNFLEDLTKKSESELINNFNSLQKDIYKIYLENYIESDTGRGNVFEEFTTFENSSMQYDYFSHLEFDIEGNGFMIIFDPKKLNNKGEKGFSYSVKLTFPQESYQSREGLYTPQLLPGARWLNLKTRFIITGGHLKNSKPTDYGFYVEYSHIFNKDALEGDKTNNLDAKLNYIRPMITPRDTHACIQINDYHMMVVGGSQTDTCEILNLLTGDWDKKPKLNSIRSQGSLILHNNMDLYLFYGVEFNTELEKTVNSDKVERLKLYLDPEFTKEESLWEIVEIKKKGLYFDGLSFSSIIPVERDVFYLVGGKINCDESHQPTNKMFIIDIEKKEISLGGEILQKPLWFYESNFVYLGEVLGFGLYSDNEDNPEPIKFKV